MPYYTEKQIEQARSIDLLTYLQTYDPTELVHIRKELKVCTQVQERSDHVRENLEIIDRDRQREKAR